LDHLVVIPNPPAHRDLLRHPGQVHARCAPAGPGYWPPPAILQAGGGVLPGPPATNDNALSSDASNRLAEWLSATGETAAGAAFIIRQRLR